MMKKFYLALFVLLTTVEISITIPRFEGVKNKNTTSGSSSQNTNHSNDVAVLKLKKKLAEIVYRTAVERVKINSKKEGALINDTIKCAKCLNLNIFTGKTPCGTECKPIVDAVETHSTNVHYKTMCKPCLYKSVIRNVPVCTHQCSVSDLNKILHGLLKKLKYT